MKIPTLHGLASLVCAFAFVIALPAAQAGAPAPGTQKAPRFQVSASDAQPDTIGSSIAADAAGNLTVVWTGGEDDHNGGQFTNIYARRFAANGQALTAQFLVHSAAHGYYGFPAVAVNRGTGEFVVTWTGNSTFDVSNTYARLFDQDGNPKGPEFQVSSAAEYSTESFVAMNQSGAFVVGWGTQSNGQGSPPYHAYIAPFDAQGRPTGPSLRLKAAFADSDYPGLGGVGISADGHFMAIWRYLNTQGYGFDVYLNCFDARGTGLGGDVLVSTSTPSSINSIAIAGAQGGDGTIAVAAPSLRINPSINEYVSGIFVRTFHQDCHAAGAEFEATGNVDAPYQGMSVSQAGPSVQVDSTTGQLAIGWTWSIQQGQGYQNSGNVRLLSLSGNALTDAISLYNIPSVYPSLVPPLVAIDGLGNLWAAWSQFIDFTTYDDVFAASFYGAPKAAAPTLSLDAQPTSLLIGSTATLTWSSANTSSCTASGDWSGTKALNGSATVTENNAGAYHFTLTCVGPGGSISKSASVNWKLPTVSFATGAERTAQSTSLSGQTSTTITVQLSAAVPRDVTVPFTLSGSEAASRYAVTPANTLLIPAHSASASVSVKITYPQYLQCDKTVVLELGTPQGATLGTITTNTLSVHNYSPLVVCVGVGMQ